MTTATTDPNWIQRDRVYPLEEFKRITGWGRTAMQSARRDGLKVMYRANRGYVSGDAFHDFLNAKSESIHAPCR